MMKIESRAPFFTKTVVKVHQKVNLLGVSCFEFVKFIQDTNSLSFNSI